jgi:methionyl-tRNA formyltransferase
MRVCLIGCVEFSDYALQKILELEKSGFCEVVGVITKSDSKFNSDFVDLGERAIKSGKSRNCVHYYKDEFCTINFLNEVQPDVIYCFGWSTLLRRSVLNIPSKGVIGFHPAKLPQNRGRHPIIWALSLGLTETASTFFKMDEGADSGPILSQKPVLIAESDTARSLYDKIVDVALGQIEEFTQKLATNRETLIEQEHSLANYWRKRSAKDGVIDWRMDARSIHNLICALSKPYPGAEFHLGGAEVYKVWGSTVERDAAPANYEPGKLLNNEGGRLLVKCGGDTAIWLEDVEPKLQPSSNAYL